MNIFVANIGNRDVAFNCGTEDNPNFVTFSKQRSQEASEVQEVLGCEPGARAVVSALSETFSDRQKLLHHLRFPILRPALKQALADCREDGELDRIVLFGTDQDPEEVPHHYPWDTITTARLLRDLLPLDSDLDLRSDVTSIEVFPVRSHPHRFESAYRHLEGVFDRFAGTDAHIYASVNGGIPALNTALRIRALNSFGPRAHLIETEEPSAEQKQLGAEGESTFADTWPYRRDALLRIARDLLDTYEYDALLDVLDRELSREEKDRFGDVVALIRHAAARFNLDFGNAAEILREGLRNESLSDDMAKPYGETATRGPSSLQRLHELSWTARIFFERGDVSNLVVRTATLRETARRQLVSLLTGVEATSGYISPDLLDDELNDSLSDAGVYTGNQGDWVNNNLFLEKCIEWSEDQLADTMSKNAVRDARDYIEDLKPIKDLRDDFLHQSEGISEDEIKRRFGSLNDLIDTLQQLLQKMKTLHGKLGDGSKVVTDLYARLNETVIRRLSA